MQINNNIRGPIIFFLLIMTMAACRGGSVGSEEVIFCDSQQVAVQSLQAVDQITFLDAAGVPLPIDSPGVTIANTFSFSTDVSSHGYSSKVSTLKWTTNGTNYQIQHNGTSYAKENFVVNDGLEINEVIFESDEDGTLVSIRFTDADGIVQIFSALLSYEYLTGGSIVFGNRTVCNVSCSEDSTFALAECSGYNCDYSCDNANKGSYKAGDCGEESYFSDLSAETVGITECAIASVALPAEVKESFTVTVTEFPSGEE